MLRQKCIRQKCAIAGTLMVALVIGQWTRPMRWILKQGCIFAQNRIFLPLLFIPQNYSKNFTLFPFFHFFPLIFAFFLRKASYFFPCQTILRIFGRIVNIHPSTKMKAKVFFIIFKLNLHLSLILIPNKKKNSIL